MDQKKIGKYIADKRKALGLTQVQLAEKLNMSNKSVSKWERGVCLPDVSVYETLCETLGISLTEFLAGEDLPEAEIIPKSEETIINITMDHKRSRRRANILLLFLIVATLAVSWVLIDFIKNKDGFLHRHCIVSLAESSPEAQTANMFAEHDPWMYRYYAKSLYNRMQIRYYWYRDGKMTEEGTLLSYELYGDHAGRGIIAVIDDYENGDLTAQVTLEGRDPGYEPDDQVCDEFRLPLNGQKLQDWQDTYTRHVIIPQNKIPINPNNNESAFLLMTYDKDSSLSMSNISKEDVFWPNVRGFCSEIAEYDYAVFITAKIWFEPPYPNYPKGASFKLWP